MLNGEKPELVFATHHYAWLDARAMILQIYLGMRFSRVVSRKLGKTDSISRRLCRELTSSRVPARTRSGFGTIDEINPFRYFK